MPGASMRGSAGFLFRPGAAPLGYGMSPAVFARRVMEPGLAAPWWVDQVLCLAGSFRPQAFR